MNSEVRSAFPRVALCPAAIRMPPHPKVSPALRHSICRLDMVMASASENPPRQQFSRRTLQLCGGAIAVFLRHEHEQGIDYGKLCDARGERRLKIFDLARRSE